MYIIFIREKQTDTDILSQVKNSVISRVQQAVNVTDCDSLILPVVPDVKFPTNASVNIHRGLTSEFSTASYKELKSIEWSSFFPVKNYEFATIGSNSNGYVYVDFLNERQENQLPFRLIAYEINNQLGSIVRLEPFRVIYDGFVWVEKFEYSKDRAKDIQYTLGLKEFDTDILRPMNKSDIGNILLGSVGNIATNWALKQAGII